MSVPPLYSSGRTSWTEPLPKERVPRTFARPFSCSAPETISLAEAVRRCVAERLASEASEGGRTDRVREALAVVGKYADPAGPSRVARDHDEHLRDAYHK